MRYAPHRGSTIKQQRTILGVLTKTLVAATATLALLTAVLWILSQSQRFTYTRTNSEFVSQSYIESSIAIYTFPSSLAIGIERDQYDAADATDFGFDTHKSASFEHESLSQLWIDFEQLLRANAPRPLRHIGIYKLKRIRTKTVEDGPRQATTTSATLDHLLIDWSLIITLLTLPLIFSMILLAARKLERRNRRRNNLCLDCGYDLRLPLPDDESRGEGSPTSKTFSVTTCPECGTKSRIARHDAKQ